MRTVTIIGTAKESFLYALAHSRTVLSVDEVYLSIKGTPHERSLPALYVAASQLFKAGLTKGQYSTDRVDRYALTHRHSSLMMALHIGWLIDERIKNSWDNDPYQPSIAHIRKAQKKLVNRLAYQAIGRKSLDGLRQLVTES